MNSSSISSTGVAFSAGAFAGVHEGALVVGVISCVCVMLWIVNEQDHKTLFTATVLSAMFAGYGSPLFATWALNKLSVEPVRNAHYILAGLIIGCLTPIVLPAVLAKASHIVSKHKE